MSTELETETVAEAPTEAELIQPLITLASALLDVDRLRIAAALANGPASRVDLSGATGLSHRDLIRQIDILVDFGLLRLEAPAPRQPDAYTRYELNLEVFRAARQAMGKYKGVKPRPTDLRLMTLETFLPGGKLTALPKKQEQITTVLNEIVTKFVSEKKYTERDVNVILEEVNEDYCTVRRLLVDYGYLSREGGIYTKNS